MEPGIKEALALLEQAHEGALATMEETKPFVSSVSFIYEPRPGAASSSEQPWGKIQLLLSQLARHTRNFLKNPEVSLLVTEGGAGPGYEKKRVTLQGIIRGVKDDSKFREFKKRYVGVFPDSEVFFSFGDFQFFEIEISELHWIAGFGKIETFK